MGGPVGGTMNMGGPTQAPNPSTGLRQGPMGPPTSAGGGPMQPTPSVSWQGGGWAPTPALSEQGQSPQPQMSNPMPAPPVPQPSQPVNGVSNQVPPVGVAQTNRMQVHNPTGIGTQQASEKAAVMRPIPATYPKKAQGIAPPAPQAIPGGKA